MDTPARMPERFRDVVAAMPEYSYGVQRIVVTFDDGTRVRDVFVGGDNEIVKVGLGNDVPFDPERIVKVENQ